MYIQGHHFSLHWKSYRIYILVIYKFTSAKITQQFSNNLKFKNYIIIIIIII